MKVFNPLGWKNHNHSHQLSKPCALCFPIKAIRVLYKKQNKKVPSHWLLNKSVIILPNRPILEFFSFFDLSKKYLAKKAKKDMKNKKFKNHKCWVLQGNTSKDFKILKLFTMDSVKPMPFAWYLANSWLNRMNIEMGQIITMRGKNIRLNRFAIITLAPFRS